MHLCFVLIVRKYASCMLKHEIYRITGRR